VYLDENLISHKSQWGKTAGQGFGDFFFTDRAEKVSVETRWRSEIFQQDKRDRIWPDEQICSGTQGITQIHSKYKIGI